MQERHFNREQYFKEQAHSTEKFYIPYIRQFAGKIPDEILEVGCAEGGNLLPFARLGCKVTGIDITASRIEHARTFFKERELQAEFIASDIFQVRDLQNKFSLIMVHDVIEHIDDKTNFLSGLKRFLTPDGYIYIAFPAWQMPFGGHQQIAHSRLISHFPFIHLFPTSLYRRILKLCNEKEDTIRELLNIKRTKCSIEHFYKVVKQANYQIVDQQLYFINPHYEIKFGLTPRKLYGFLSHIPYLRNIFSTSCFYMIRPITF